MLPIVAVVGKSNSGKTTLLERLIPVLVSRGLRVGTIKHDTHGFDMDKPGKDTWKHRQAGSSAVAIIGPDRTAVIRETETPPGPEEVAARFMGKLDIVLAEGFKRSRLPKIEVSRRERSTDLIASPADGLLAVVADHPVEPGVPVFGWDEPEKLADLLQAKFLSHRPRTKRPLLATGGRPLELAAFIAASVEHSTRGLMRGLKGVDHRGALRIVIGPGAEPEVVLEADGEARVLKPYVQGMLAGAIRGLAETLDGVEPEAALVVEMEARRGA